jgi:hypothetical protein
MDNREEASCVTVAGDRARPRGGVCVSRDEVSSEKESLPHRWPPAFAGELTRPATLLRNVGPRGSCRWVWRSSAK